MKLSSTRDLSKNRPVLKDTNSTGPDPVYWVFSEVTEEKWANITIVASGRYSSEYPKTFGHYHNVGTNETYYLIEGDAILLLQKKYFEDGAFVPERVEEVLLIKLKPGDTVTLTPEYGHSVSNIGVHPLISYDDWRSGHTPADYEDIKRLQGMAYYLVEEGGEVKAVPNRNYLDLPEPIWLTAQEFKDRQS